MNFKVDSIPKNPEEWGPNIKGEHKAEALPGAAGPMICFLDSGIFAASVQVLKPGDA